jgi:hypothetical protein
VIALNIWPDSDRGLEEFRLGKRDGTIGEMVRGEDRAVKHLDAEKGKLEGLVEGQEAPFHDAEDTAAPPREIVSSPVAAASDPKLEGVAASRADADAPTRQKKAAQPDAKPEGYASDTVENYDLKPPGTLAEKDAEGRMIVEAELSESKETATSFDEVATEELAAAAGRSVFGAESPPAAASNSYVRAREQIKQGLLPPRDEVRVTEFVNYFDQGYPEVREGEFEIHADGMPSPFSASNQLLRVGIQGRPAVSGDDGVEPLSSAPREPAYALQLRVEFDRGLVTRFKLLGDGLRGATDNDLRVAALNVAELGAARSLAALYEIELSDAALAALRGAGGRSGEATARLGTVTLRYKVARPGSGDELRTVERALRLGDLVLERGDATARLRLDALVAEFAALLGGAGARPDGRIASLVDPAEAMRAELPEDPDAAELVELLRQAAELEGQK